jgi:hypothetical protein
MDKSLLTLISDQYEQAKRALFEAKRGPLYDVHTGQPIFSSDKLAVLEEACRVWGHALHLAQSKRGERVHNER